jgi:hypothetical protein
MTAPDLIALRHPALALPAEDRAISPYTGWTREHWAAVADHLLLSLRPYFSATRARVLPPGHASAYGTHSDGLEGFARSFLLFGFRLVGEAGADPHGFLDWYRAGLIAGTDPRSPDAWPTPGELGQAKVEAASIALVLDLTRPWLWQTLAPKEQQNVIAWLATAVGQEYPPTNWLWFRVTVETFLASVGGPYSAQDVHEDLALFGSLYRGHGWYSDGPERSFDYYCGWAMQFYPLIWAQRGGADAFGAASLVPAWRERLAEFLDDYITLIGSDGMPVLQGRSLIYRFAAAAPLWVGAQTGATRLGAGLLRRGASGILKAFVERGGISEKGLLTLGLFGEWPAMAQSYSGSGSPYWAAKGMFGLALPASHPVWTAVEEPLPIERGDVLRVLPAPGWIVSGTRANGIVRLFNHGTDHASLGDQTTDSPLYARLGYSSATIPPLIGDTLSSPVDNAVCVLDAAGRASHRTGFVPLGGGFLAGGAVWAASRADVHWVDATADSTPDHGSGRNGVVTVGPRLTVASIVRGAWEVRVVRVDAAAPTPVAASVAVPGEATVASSADSRVDGYTLRVSGWPLAGVGEEKGSASERAVVVRQGALDWALHVIAGPHGHGSVRIERGTSPLGDVVAVPWLQFSEVGVDDVLVIAVGLGTPAPGLPTVALRKVEKGHVVDVRWPDDSISSISVNDLAP